MNSSDYPNLDFRNCSNNINIKNLPRNTWAFSGKRTYSGEGCRIHNILGLFHRISIPFFPIFTHRQFFFLIFNEEKEGINETTNPWISTLDKNILCSTSTDDKVCKCLSIQLSFDQQGKSRETKTGGKLKKRKYDQRMRRIQFSNGCLKKRHQKR